MDKIGLNTRLVVIFGLGVFSTVSGSTPCPPLPAAPGLFISCENPQDNTKVPCVGPVSGVPKRTVAKYKCEEAPSFSDSVLECKCRGKWRGMEAFQNYSLSCGSIQTNFSLNGPSELNFTEQKIQDLNQNQSISDNVPGFAKDALAYHNFYRMLHRAAPLKLNSTLSQAAQQWAENEVSTDKLEAEPWSSNRTYISNLYGLSGPQNFSLSKAAKLAVGRWYKSSEGYDYEVPVANAFSSMIWNSTTDLGVGIAQNGADVVVVCNYWPAGNIYVVGGNSSSTDYFALFKRNVFPPVKTTVSDSSDSPSSLSTTTTTITTTSMP